MKSHYHPLIVITAAHGLLMLSANASLILPSGFEVAEDDGWSGVLSTPMRLQEVYGAVHFPAAPIVVDSIRFRLDSMETAVSVNLASITFTLSTSPRQPDALSANFSDNIGADSVVVYSGPLGVSASGGSSPNPFEIVVGFTTPFAYDPSRGSLLVDISNPSGSGFLWLVDASNDHGDNASRIFDYNTASPSANQVDTGADIILLGYTVIPEPSAVAWALSMLGLAVGTAVKWVKRSV